MHGTAEPHTHRATRHAILFIGPLPPPTHGQSVATLAIREALEARGAVLRVCDTAEGVSARPIRLIRKLFRATQAVFTILTSPAGGNAYISVNSGRGVWLTYLFCLAARIRKRHVFLHYHAYRLIHKPTLGNRAMMRSSFATAGATHITLSARMTADLIDTYCQVERVLELNNAGLIDPELRRTPTVSNNGEIVLGHLSNLSFEKGIAEVVDFAIGLSLDFPSVRLAIAGPTMTDFAASAVARAKRELGGRFSYLGPIYGREKLDFFSSITHFVFPSKDEASPLVLFEALAAGVSPIGLDVGAVADIIGDAGCLVSSKEAFRDAAASWIRENPLGNQRAARSHFDDMLRLHHAQVERLASALTGAPGNEDRGQ